MTGTPPWCFLGTSSISAVATPWTSSWSPSHFLLLSLRRTVQLLLNSVCGGLVAECERVQGLQGGAVPVQGVGGDCGRVWVV